MKKKQRTDQFKSDEELYFSWWLDELNEKGIVLNWKYEYQTYCLSPCIKEMINGKEKTLLAEHYYTPDFHIVWNIGYSKKLGVRLQSEGMFSSVVDIKGKYTRNFNDTAFPINQKWMYDKLGIYVDKIVPIAGFVKNSKKVPVLKKCLFSETFTPKKYLLTTTGKERTIHWKVRTIDQFLEEIR